MKDHLSSHQDAAHVSSAARDTDMPLDLPEGEHRPAVPAEAPTSSTIASVQKDAGETPDKNAYTDTQRKFSDAVNALSESLSKVAGTIL